MSKISFGKEGQIPHDFLDILQAKRLKAFNIDEKVLRTDRNNIQSIMHKQLTQGISGLDIGSNGFYYIHMVHGTWINHFSIKEASDEQGNKYSPEEYGEFSDGLDSDFFKNIGKTYPTYATDIDIPQLNIEYDTLSGRVRNLNYASKIHFASDFSINYIDNVNKDFFKYHETWFKYVEACKKGYFKKSALVNNYKGDPGDYFIDVPYFNAVWVAVFDSFSTNIRALIKILGVSPINLPFKQILGDRGKNELTTLNINYKSNDMVYKFFENEDDLVNSPLYKEFLKDITDHLLDIPTGETV
ncbi:MAG: hypothetical protein WC136_01775 [Sphaerochaeta sp.]|jgi:hypothetical protein